MLWLAPLVTFAEVERGAEASSVAELESGQADVAIWLDDADFRELEGPRLENDFDGEFLSGPEPAPLARPTWVPYLGRLGNPGFHLGAGAGLELSRKDARLLRGLRKAEVELDRTRGPPVPNFDLARSSLVA